MTHLTPPATSTASPLTRQTAPGLDVTRLACPAHREYHFTVRPLPGEAPAATAGRLAAAVTETGAAVVRHEVFGSLAAGESVMDTLRQRFGEIDWPVTWVEGEADQGAALAGMHVMAVADTAVETLELDGRPIGRVFSDGRVKHCLLGDLRATDVSASRPDQARVTFENLERALHAAGLKMHNLVRTWLYLDDILAWYGPFNAVRTEFFQQRKVFSGLVPASTGVGGRNPAGAAMVAAAWAVSAQGGSLPAREVASPLQCPAPEYGSSFSRAVKVLSLGCRRLLVSGTASIEPNGRTAHPDDIAAQVALTMDVVRAILVSRKLDFRDVTRATAYFKDLKDVPVFKAWRSANGLERMPVMDTHCVVCRDDLLFEIEMDALAPAPEA